jgi:hypothetical protein
MKYPYMLSDTYCQNWVIQDAIREVVANALSTHDEVELDWRNGKGYVRNLKKRLEVRHLLIGESDSRDDKEAIGTFGEGLKIAGLVFCRNNRTYIAKTSTNIFEFGLEYAPDFERHILTVDVKPADNTDIKGTSVEFDCTDDEFYFAKGLFRELSPIEVYDNTFWGSILKEPRKIYVLGVFIGEQDTLFGYDIKEKTLINRDRTIVDASRIQHEIKWILQQTTNHEVIKELIEANIRRDKVIETQFELDPSWGEQKKAWKNVVDEMGKVAIACGNAEVDAQAGYLGFNVIDAGHLNATLRKAGLETAKNVQPKPAKHFISIDQLSKSEKTVLGRAAKLYKDVAKCPSCEIRISEELEEDNSATREDSKITLNRKILYSLPKTFRSLCHEGAHIKSDSGDCSAEFEKALCDIIENIAKSKLVPKQISKEEIQI